MIARARGAGSRTRGAARRGRDPTGAGARAAKTLLPPSSSQGYSGGLTSPRRQLHMMKEDAMYRIDAPVVSVVAPPIAARPGRRH
jgi:hypothetical protein